MLREFCSPIFDLENMTKSSAYKIEFNFLQFAGGTKGSAVFFQKRYGMSLINRNGLRIQPWCTPLAYGKGRVCF